MEKESKQPKLGTPEAKRELDALHKLMRRYTAATSRWRNYTY